MHNFEPPSSEIIHSISRVYTLRSYVRTLVLCMILHMYTSISGIGSVIPLCTNIYTESELHNY